MHLCLLGLTNAFPKLETSLGDDIENSSSQSSSSVGLVIFHDVQVG